MNDLIQYLRQYGRLTQEQCGLIIAKAQPANVKKGAYFSEAGRVSRRIGFVTDGVFRVCYYDRHGADFTRYFIYEHRFVADMSSFMDELPSAEYIEAVTDATVLEFSREDFTALANDIPEWTDIFAKITSSVLENKMKAAGNMLVQDAQSRYLHFLEHYPGLANRIPQTMLASYLGITATSLSRIRKSIR
ncbi:Crp/Fnr family transcriptional regulator [Chitinophaga sedimenti]|uniref:Crp/Fnr family transcriptional regulator n=1 Tax=Chitinophaga sedimenti TaxID=2033606 RepID=UPI002003895D|nr:Crp/Fnr family transcriptional regulator [Chitinophaga sedimenti]MCK7555816.1 Crp/Fnr family transcriptional regulator [Chitinophaga sedimenti]